MVARYVRGAVRSRALWYVQPNLADLAQILEARTGAGSRAARSCPSAARSATSPCAAGRGTNSGAQVGTVSAIQLPFLTGIGLSNANVGLDPK